jgi:hypothetical protein
MSSFVDGRGFTEGDYYQSSIPQTVYLLQQRFVSDSHSKTE